jgi:uncharacterized protein with von Willebrand factor type A (vWA) domain
MSADSIPSFLWAIVGQVRRRRLQVGIGDVQALRLALCAGFGLSSRDELRELCVLLWAKSPADAEVVRAAFARLDDLADWAANSPGRPGPGSAPSSAPQAADAARPEEVAGAARPEEGDAVVAAHAVRAINVGLGSLLTAARDRGLVMVPQYPLTAREVAQALRHLRRPVRTGPTVELDVAATIRERARRGVANPPVLVPRRRNAVRLLMLMDRHGSMTPFHGYVDYVVGAIRHAGRIDDVSTAYFHDVPGTLVDRGILESREDPFRPDLDDVLGLIEPLPGGRVYTDPGLTDALPLSSLLTGGVGGSAILVISDAGAARGKFDISRLLDTIALVKALRLEGGGGLAWLNPMPAARWRRTTAGQVARHVPMYGLSRAGLHQAVDALRGRPVLVERPA